MFRIKFAFTARIIECPTDPIGAVDFRRANGLPDAPTATQRVTVDIESEAVARAFPYALDAYGNFSVYSWRRHFDADAQPYWVRTDANTECQWGKSYDSMAPYDVPLSAAVIVGANAGTEEGVLALLTVLAAAIEEMYTQAAAYTEACAAAKAAEQQAACAAAEARILADARAGKLYRQGPRGIERATDLC